MLDLKILKSTNPTGSFEIYEILWHQVLHPLGTKWFRKELSKFEQSDAGRKFPARFKESMDYVSENIGVTLDFEGIAYLTRGFELTVRFTMSQSFFHAIHENFRDNNFTFHRHFKKNLYLRKHLVWSYPNGC